MKATPKYMTLAALLDRVQQLEGPTPRHLTASTTVFSLLWYWKYLVRASIVVILNIISWGVFRMRGIPVLRQRSLRGYCCDWCQSVTINTPEIYVGAERYSERLEMIAGMILACVAFQYVIDDSLPSLTTMDWLLVNTVVRHECFGVFVHDFSIDGSNFRQRLSSALYYFGMQSFHILHAYCTQVCILPSGGARLPTCCAYVPSVLWKTAC